MNAQPIRQHDPEAAALFEVAMNKSGWTPRRDVFGKILEWSCKVTGKPPHGCDTCQTK